MIDNFPQEDSEGYDIQTLVAWLAVKTSNPVHLAESLKLSNIQTGTWNDIIEVQDSTKTRGNTFILAYENWSVVFSEVLISITNEVLDGILIGLSLEFKEAQSFLIDTEYTFSYGWRLAKGGKMVRSFSIIDNNIDSFGSATEIEETIDWDIIDANEEGELGDSLGPREVLMIAKEWSIDPILDNHPGEQQGIVGFLRLEE